MYCMQFAAFENMNISTIVDTLTCPITAEIMKDPVQGTDGQTYERSAILHALSIKKESPITRQPMTEANLTVNAAIRFLCDKYHSGELGGSVELSQDKPKAIISNHNIKLDHSLHKNSENVTMLSFGINEESYPEDMLEFKHLPQDVVIVIDHSGSMNAGAEAKDANGQNYESGLSNQDLANHSAKTVAKTLDSNSRLAVVKFDNNIETVFDLMNMTELNKTRALSQIDTIRPQGQTNIWGGIEEAIRILDEREDKSRNGAIIMLTDGTPNLSPARGEVETLKRLRVKKNFTSPIYCFGFGYNLQKDLLYDMSKYANGCMGHIPDGSMIATVFCNFTGTILTTVAVNLQLHIIPNDNNNYFAIVAGDYPCNFNSSLGEYIYDIGTVQYQQERNIILNTASDSNFKYYFTYKIGGESYTSETNDITKITRTISNDEVNSHICRYFAVENIRKMINLNRVNDNAGAMEIFNQTVAYLKEQNNATLITNIIKNFEGVNTGEKTESGQVNLAVSNPAYFNRWGEFYLDQLSRALNQQIKPNFKDSACMFGGDVFDDVVDKASDIFDTLPPPTPSLINTYRGGAYNSTPRPRAQVNMSAYNDPGGGCFDINSRINMADGSTKLIKDLKMNDLVMTLTYEGEYSMSKVLCVVETIITNKSKKMCKIDDLYITSWHPILYNDKWEYPENITNATLVNCDSMATLFLENDHIVVVNDIPCITLGHNYTYDVLNHPFYGTYAVIEFLKQQEGWSNGHIKFEDIHLNYYRSNDIVVDMSYKSLFNDDEVEVALI